MKPHIIIVGGGFGGLTLARNLAKHAFKITLIPDPSVCTRVAR